MKKTLLSLSFASALLVGMFFTPVRASSEELEPQVQAESNPIPENNLATFVTLNAFAVPSSFSVGLSEEIIPDGQTVFVNGVVKVTSSYRVILQYLDGNQQIVTERIPTLVPTRVSRKFDDSVTEKSKSIKWVRAKIVDTKNVVKATQLVPVFNAK